MGLTDQEGAFRVSRFASKSYIHERLKPLLTLQLALFSNMCLAALLTFKQQHSRCPSGLAICCQRIHLSFQHATLLLLATKVLIEAVSVDVNITRPAISPCIQLYKNGDVAYFAPIPGRTPPPPCINLSSCLPG